MIKRNYESNVKGFKYVSLDNIENFNSKLKAIGLNEDFVPNRGVLYLYLIKYLGVVTKDQLCTLTGSLKNTIHVSIDRLNKSVRKKSDFLVDIDADANDREVFYYTATKSATDYLLPYANSYDMRGVNFQGGIRHLSKINDFYLSLFKNSGCESLVIDYNKVLIDEVDEDATNSTKGKILADGYINATFNSMEYTIYLELDNNTETLSVLNNKINNYFNFCLHDKSLLNEKPCYFVFRFDTSFKFNVSLLCNNIAIKAEEYAMNKRECDKLAMLRVRALKCQDISELVDFINENSIDIEGFEFKSDEFDKNLNEFAGFLSYKKSGFEFNIENLKRNVKADLVCERIKERVTGTKKIMLDEFNVKQFDFDSEESIYEDISGKKRFSIEYEKMDGSSLLLRTNFLCGDLKLETWFNKFVFNKEDKLIELANDFRGSRHFDNKKVRTQKFMKLGEETLCFSNLIDDSSFEIRPFTNYALLMPSVSVSDLARIEYICDSDDDVIEKDLNNDYLLIFILVDNERDEKFYNEMISKYKSTRGQIVLVVHKVNL